MQRPSKQTLLDFHKNLVKKERFDAGRLLLRFMITGLIHVRDDNRDAYESGLAAFLLENYEIDPSAYGFIIYCKNGVYDCAKNNSKNKFASSKLLT